MMRGVEMREELKWFASFPKEMEQFRGKHVAIIGRKVVASGDSAKEVFEKAKKEYPDKMPVLAFIPRREALVL
jgi:lysine/ornithine N-monooxygenase